MPRILAQRLGDGIDWVLFGICLAISFIGVLNLYSTGRAAGHPDLYLTQIYFLVFGGIIAYAVAAIDYRHMERFGYVLYGIGIVLLILVLIVGTEINNSRRWFVFGTYHFQPSELMKVLLVIGLAKHLKQDPHKETRKFTDILIPSLMTVLVMFLIIKEPDLGTALLCLLIFLSIIMLTRLSFRAILVLLGTAPVAFILAWTYLLKPYQKTRINSYVNMYFDPEADKLGAGWQTHQSTVAIGSGQVTGKGFANGTAGPHHFLPEQTTDFPLAIFAEEHGFIGAGLLILLYCILILWCIRVGAHARDRFGAVVAIGVGSIFFWHVFINLGMVMGVLPVVGVTLPLFSAGGSSILTFMICIGLLMNVSIHQFRR